MEIKDYLKILRKRIWLIGGTIVLITFIAAVISFNIPKVYRCSAKVLVEKPMRVLLLQPGDIRSGAPQALDMETNLKLLKSQPVGEEVAKVLGMDKKAAFSLIGQIYVYNIPETGLIEISTETTDPNWGAKLVNTFAKVFVRKSKEFAVETQTATLKFIEEQLKKAKEILQIAEENLLDFKKEHGFVKIDDEINRINLFLSQLDSEKIKLQLEREEILAKAPIFQEKFNIEAQKLFESNGSFLQKDYVLGIQSELTKLENLKLELLSKYTPEHPKILEIEKKIKETQLRLSENVSNLVSEESIDLADHINTKREIDALNTKLIMSAARMSVIDKVSKMQKEKLKTLPELSFEYTKLERAQQTAADIYNMLSQKYEQAKIDQVQQVVKVKIFEEAFPSGIPVRPNRKKNIGFSVIIGALLGVLISFFLEQFEVSIRSSEDVKNYLNLTVLGSIPYSYETINKLITEVPLKSPMAEAYRRLSFFVQLYCIDPIIKTLLVTSCKSDEGKTTTLSNLAITIVQEGGKVIIIDTDLRRPMLHRLFNVDNSLGISQILSGELEAQLKIEELEKNKKISSNSMLELVIDRVMQPVEPKGLFLIPSGPLPQNPLELLKSKKMKDFLEIIKKKADLILLDSPPAIHVIDAIALANILDGVLMVINSGKVTRDEVQQVKIMIESTNTKIIGVALNNIEVGSPDYYYYYYYGGYGYGGTKRKRISLKK